MTEPWRSLAVFATSTWVGALALGILAIRLLFRRLGRTDAWPAFTGLAPLVDLAGTWAGTLAVLALFLGRRGYGWSWASALFLVALAITATLYDRAVLLPSLDAAHRRLRGADDEDRARWEDEWRFLWRMAAAGRLATLAAVLGALGFLLAS